nr:hypothetical protein [Mucilaginibacter sp. SP1R1]
MLQLVISHIAGMKYIAIRVRTRMTIILIYFINGY